MKRSASGSPGARDVQQRDLPDLRFLADVWRVGSVIPARREAQGRQGNRIVARVEVSGERHAPVEA